MIGRWPVWAVIFTGTLALFAVIVASEDLAGNPRLLPELIAIGAFAVPVSFVVLVRDLLPGSDVPPRALVTCFVAGGVIGTAAASVLEYDVLRDFGVLPSIFVGAIEEPAKLLVPLIAFAVGAYRRTADGIVLGVAAGMGFAAFETMGYALGALAGPHGSVSACEDVLLLRGALAPCGHPAWTGTVCAALWWTRRRPRADRTLFVAPAAFVAAVLLHAGWDAVDAPLGQSAIGMTSVALLLGWLVVARHEPLESAAALPRGARLPRAA
jgi:RsiW-degrading membrane proteinase PrsW (M82 family)